MSGNYPDVPSYRMAYDRDGTQVYFINRSNVLTQLTGGQMANLNDENSGTAGYTTPDNSGGYLFFWFPERRDLDAYFVASVTAFQNITFGLEVSTNSTNGVDGTWTTVVAYAIGAGSAMQATIPNYRSAIQSCTALGIKAAKMQFASNGNAITIPTIHLYGEPVPGENPNRLSLWHPTLDQRIVPAHFDWGDVPRSSSADRTFRVKNLSSTLTANSVRVAQEILTDATSGNPSVPGQHTLSADGTTFTAQINVGNLAPSALSGVCTLRRNTPSNAQLGLFAHRVFAEANSWS